MHEATQSRVRLKDENQACLQRFTFWKFLLHNIYDKRNTKSLKSCDPGSSACSAVPVTLGGINMFVNM